jgi:hypothetical protein
VLSPILSRKSEGAGRIRPRGEKYDEQPEAEPCLGCLALAAGAPMVNTSNAFDNKQIEQLPIEARNVVEILSLQPGVLFSLKPCFSAVGQEPGTQGPGTCGTSFDWSELTSIKSKLN